MAWYIGGLADVRELRKGITLPKGYNWRRCKQCIHYGEEIKWNDKFYKGRFCVHMADIYETLDDIDICRRFQKRKKYPDGHEDIYLRECAPRVIDAEHFF